MSFLYTQINNLFKPFSSEEADASRNRYPWKKSKLGWETKTIKLLSHLRPTITTDPVTSMPIVSFDASVELEADSIQEVLDLIESLSKNKRFVVWKSLEQVFKFAGNITGEIVWITTTMSSQ